MAPMRVQLKLQRIVRLPVDQIPYAALVQIAQHLPIRPMLPRTALLRFTRKPHLHVVGQRAGNIPLHQRRIEAAILHRQPALEILRRLVQHIIDRTTRCVPPIQSALRPPQHLHTRHIENLPIRLIRDRKRHLIHIQPNRGRVVARVILEPHAANRKLQLPAAELRRNGQRWRQILQIHHIVHVVQRQFLAGKHADRTAHLLHALAALLRRYRNLLQNLRGRRRGGLRGRLNTRLQDQAGQARRSQPHGANAATAQTRGTKVKAVGDAAAILHGLVPLLTRPAGRSQAG